MDEQPEDGKTIVRLELSKREEFDLLPLIGFQHGSNLLSWKNYIDTGGEADFWWVHATDFPTPQRDSREMS